MDIWKISDLSTPWCVHVVATLRVAHHINSGLTDVDEIAAACGAHSESLERVLRQLVSQGLFTEPRPRRFELNESARALLDEGARLGLDLDGFGGRMANAWSTLLQAVRTGSPAYHEAFGRPFWDDLDAHPHIAAEFDDLMGPAGHGIPDPHVLINDDDWRQVRSVVDIGGGTGALLAQILRTWPHVYGTLVEVPRAAEKSYELFRAAGVSDRVTVVAQSFFDPLPVGADVYLMKSVLSNWPDAEARTILSRCAEAARLRSEGAGRIVLSNGVTPDEKPSPDLLMLVLVGGKDRTLEQFRQLAQSAGLEVTGTAKQNSGRFIVEARPATKGVSSIPMLASRKIMAFAGTQNPERAKVFYGTVLGLPLMSEDPFALSFDAGGTMLRVTRVQQVVAAPYTVLGWEVPDIVTAVSGLTRAGVHFERYPGIEQDELGIWTAPGGGRIAWFRDPDGNLLSLAELR